MKRAIAVVLQVTLLVGLTTAAIGNAPAGAVTLAACSGSTTFPANDDGSTGAVPMGFTLNFFGTNYSNVFVNNNGNVTFSSPLNTFTPSPIGTGLNFPIIAPFWADVDTRGGGSAAVTYGTTTYGGHAAFCVSWPGVGYFGFGTDKLNTFQLLLVDRSDVGAGDFDIIFNYQQIQWETGGASGGHDGLGGSSARAGYSDGVANAFELPGSAVNGALLDSNLSTGLIYNSTGGAPAGQYVYPVRSGIPVNATLTLTKTGSPDPVPELNPITYTLTAGNSSSIDATNVVVTDNLPAGTTFDSASTSQGTCSNTATTVTCPIGTLSAGGSATVTVIVQAPNVSSDTSIENDASASADNAATVDASALTDVQANTGGSSQGTVPPDDNVPLVFTTSTDSTGNGAPAVDGTDTTSVSLRVPAGGPGGDISLQELPCTQSPCSGPGSGPAPATSSVVLGDVVFNVVPPPGYPANTPFRATLLYDVSLNPTQGPIFYFKDGVTPTEIALPKCGKAIPRGAAPCLVASKMLVTSNPLTNGDWKVVVKLNSDPRMHK